MRDCPYCGGANPDTAQYCGHCNRLMPLILGRPTPPPPPPPPAPTSTPLGVSSSKGGNRTTMRKLAKIIAVAIIIIVVVLIVSLFVIIEVVPVVTHSEFNTPITGSVRFQYNSFWGGDVNIYIDGHFEGTYTSDTWHTISGLTEGTHVIEAETLEGASLDSETFYVYAGETTTVELSFGG